MADIPQVKFNSPWTVANIEAELNGTKEARGSGTMSEALAAKANVTDLTAEATARSTADAALQASIATVADAGAKNVLHTLRESGSSTTGLTYNLNADGTYTLGGTTSADANISALCTLADIPESYVGKTVKLTGAFSANIRLAVYNGNTQTEYTDNGDGVEFTVTSTMRTTPYTIRLLVRSGTDCSGKVIKPMLRLASIPGDGYQQYAPTNRELYETKIALADVFGYGSLIEDNTDLNTLTAIGKYYGGNTAGNSCTNLPIAKGTFNFTMEVKQVTPSAIIQSLKVCNQANDPYIFIRRRTGSTWQSWYKFEGIQV